MLLQLFEKYLFVDDYIFVQDVHDAYESSCTVQNALALTFLFGKFIDWIHHSDLSSERFGESFCNVLDEDVLLRILYDESFLEPTVVREGAMKVPRRTVP
jgi:hypothetical protein